MFKFKISYMTRLWLTLWLPVFGAVVFGAVICASFLLKKMKHDKYEIDILKAEIVRLKSQTHQAEIKCLECKMSKFYNELLNCKDNKND